MAQNPLNYELPNEVRDFAEKSVEQARKAFDGFLGAASKAVTAAETQGATVQVNTAGPAAFGTGPDALFKVLGDIVTHLQTNDDAGLNADLTRLDNATSNVQNALGSVGARYNRVESMQNAAASKLVTLTDQLSATEDIDLPKTIMELQLQQTAYQAALGSTAKVIQPSLMDFLK